ncbi:MAG: hypothetical protein D6732_06510 [Methanobacteriota archaeon]|nr:MAG: hypothetical protein D6732_06510 [Euryarchaeota archaeon]
MEIQDTFSQCLTTIVQKFSPSTTRSQILVETGHWLRISLALQLPRQINIGHPAGENSWDILGIVNTAFSGMGINYDLFIGERRYSRGHKTAANAKYRIDWEHAHLISHIEDLKKAIEGIEDELTLVALPDGSYKVVSERNDAHAISKDKLLEKMNDLMEMPLGPILLQVNSISPSNHLDLPWNAILYWGWTFERGEEPTEIEGNGGFSTVSGWKAYARWMQSYLFDNRKAIHPFIETIPYLLLDRKKTSIEYWAYLAEKHEIEMSATIASRFREIAEDSLPLIQDLIDAYERQAAHRTIREKVSACYFNDQRTLEVFNLSRKHYNDLQHRKKPW